MSYISDHKIRNTHSHHLPEQAMVDFDLDKLINNTYLQWHAGNSGDQQQKAELHIWKKHDINPYFVWLQKAIRGVVWNIGADHSSRTGTQISDQIRKAHQNPDFYMDVLKNKCKYQNSNRRYLLESGL